MMRFVSYSNEEMNFVEGSSDTANNMDYVEVIILRRC